MSGANRPEPAGARAKRLAIITMSEVIGGHEVQLAHLARAKSADHAVTLIVTSEAAERYFSEHGLATRLIRFSRTGKIWRQWRNARALRADLAPVAPGFDAFLVSGGTIEACVAPARALKLLRPDLPVTAYLPMYIDRATTHGLLGTAYNQASRLFIGSIDRFVTINRIQARLIARHYRRPVSIVPNVIVPIPAPTADHGPRLVYVGRLDDQQKNLSGAIALLDHPDNPFRALHVFGDGPDRAALEARARETGRIAVTFHGWASHSRLSQELGRRDILVMNSRWEGEPLIVRELAAAGIPAVGTDIPGFRGLLPRQSRFNDQAGLLAILRRLHAERSGGLIHECSENDHGG